MAEGWMSTDRHSPSKQQADLQKPRPRFGLSAFFRPQKTVCPLTQQAALDGVHVTKAEPLTSSPPTQLEGMDDRADSCSAWGTLPEHLVEAVVQLLLEEPQPTLHSTSKPIKQVPIASCWLPIVRHLTSCLNSSIPSHSQFRNRKNIVNICV